MNKLLTQDPNQEKVVQEELGTLRHFANQVATALRNTNAFMAYATSIRSWVFNGPVGLAKNWIWESNPKAFEYITNAAMSSEVPEVKRQAQRILRGTGGYLIKFPRNSKRLSWTFSQVRNMSELSENDQDRITAEELFFRYDDYKNLINFLGSHPDLVQAVQNWWIWDQSDSSKTGGIMLPFLPSTLEGIHAEWVSAWTNLIEGWVGGRLTEFGLMLMIQPDVLVVSRETLTRFEHVMKTTEQAKARSIISGALHDAGVLAARKRGWSWNAPKKPELTPIGQLSPTPISS